MVVTPKQLENVGKKTKLKELENEIDKALKDAALNEEDLRGGAKGVFGIEMPKYLKQGSKIYHQLVQMYKSAGWEVKYTDTRVLGEFLFFEPIRGG